MKPSSNTYIPKGADPIFLAFFEWLKLNHPTSTLAGLHLELVNRAPFKVTGVKNPCNGVTNSSLPGMTRFSHMKVALGTPKAARPAEKVLHTIAHEYKHALQHDEDAPMNCIEANSFAAYVVPHFLQDRPCRSNTLSRACPTLHQTGTNR